MKLYGLPKTARRFSSRASPLRVIRAGFSGSAGIVVGDNCAFNFFIGVHAFLSLEEYCILRRKGY